MTLLDLLVRWLRHRGASTVSAEGTVHVELAPDDALRTTLGERFTLAHVAPEQEAPPGVEPVYPGSRIADLCAGDLESTTGIAIVSAPAGSRLIEPVFVYSFRAVFLTGRRNECLIRFALRQDGRRVDLPRDGDGQLSSFGQSDPWLERIETLFPSARRLAGEEAMNVGRQLEAKAQRDLYIAARRLANVYRQYRETSDDEAEIAAEYRTRLAEEVERHRLRITVTPIGVTVLVP